MTSPLPRLLAIEFPGVLRDRANPSRALDALGGEGAVQTYVKTPPTSSAPRLVLNLRPSNDVSPSNIIADAPRNTKKLFLLQVTQPFQEDTTSSAKKKATATLVGQVISMTEFRSLADFQYQPSEAALNPYSSLNIHGTPVRPVIDTFNKRAVVAERVLQALTHRPAKNLSLEQCIDRLRPNRFARPTPDRGSFNYWYRQYAFNPTGAKQPPIPNPLTFIPGQPLGNDRRSQPDRLQILPHRVSYAIDDVPKDAPPVRAPLCRGRAAYTKLLSLLRLLFQQRPIWLRRALLLGVPAELRTSFSKAVANVAYSFRGSGAFFQACVKYGYDPRKDPSSRKYQVLEVRCGHPLLEAVRIVRQERREAGEGSIVSDADDMTLENQKAGLSRVSTDLFKMPKEFVFEGVPVKKNNFFQICDIQVKEIQDIIDQQPVSTPYDNKNGFFSEESLSLVMSTIKNSIFNRAKDILGQDRSKEILKVDMSTISSLQNKKRTRLQLKDVMKEGTTKLRNANGRVTRSASRRKVVEEAQAQATKLSVNQRHLDEQEAVDEAAAIDTEHPDEAGDIEGSYQENEDGEDDDSGEDDMEEDGAYNDNDDDIDDTGGDDAFDFGDELKGFEIYDSDDNDMIESQDDDFEDDDDDMVGGSGGIGVNDDNYGEDDNKIDQT